MSASREAQQKSLSAQEKTQMSKCDIDKLVKDVIKIHCLLQVCGDLNRVWASSCLISTILGLWCTHGSGNQKCPVQLVIIWVAECQWTTLQGLNAPMRCHMLLLHNTSTIFLLVPTTPVSLVCDASKTFHMLDTLRQVQSYFNSTIDSVQLLSIIKLSMSTPHSLAHVLKVHRQRQQCAYNTLPCPNYNLYVAIVSGIGCSCFLQLAYWCKMTGAYSWISWLKNVPTRNGVLFV